MEHKNSKLAKENTDLKETISRNMNVQESLLQSTIKAEYFESLAYKSTLQTIDENIRCIEECLESCKRVRAEIVAGHKRSQNRENGVLNEACANTWSRKGGKAPESQKMKEDRPRKGKKPKKGAADEVLKRLKFKRA